MKKKEMNKSTAELVDTYETEIEFTCPVRGRVKQKVKVRRFESITPSAVEEPLPSKNLSVKLDREYSGLLLDDNTIEDDKEEEIE